MLPFRGWEFGIGMFGALLLKNQIFKQNITTYKLDLFFLIILVLIFIDFFSINNINFLPQFLVCSVTFFYLTLGTNVSNNNFIKFLSSVGKASYPIYLIHWPILVIYSYAFLREIQELERFLLLIFSIIIGFVISIIFEKNTYFNLKLYQNKLFSFNLLSTSTILCLLALNRVPQ